MPTPYVAVDEALLMVSPSQQARIACVGAAMQLGLRPIVVTHEALFQVAATSRPLVIVVEFDPVLDPTSLKDLAVSVGAQLVEVGISETGEQLVQRILLAGQAARSLRKNEPQ